MVYRKVVQTQHGYRFTMVKNYDQIMVPIPISTIVAEETNSANMISNFTTNIKKSVPNIQGKTDPWFINPKS